jgi:ATP-dependent protease ClpP protease subunit
MDRNGLSAETLDVPNGTAMDIRQITVECSPKNRSPYCPVYVSQLDNGRKVFSAYINGGVIDVGNYIDLIDSLLTCTEKDQYYIFLDSPGGLISSGSIIASAIDSCKGEVFTVARGLCASAAALIHNAAKPGHAIVGDMGVIMIHMSSHSDEGVSTFIADRANNQVRYVNENLLATALERGYINAEQLATIQDGNEIFISAEEFRVLTQRGN